MPNIRFALIQSELHWENADENLAMFSTKINSVSQNCDIILLPEMFNTGFTMNVEKVSEDMSGKTFHWIKEIASKTGKVICGSFICSEDGKYFNRLIWMNPSGEFQHYDKRHLFRMAGEDEHFSGGEHNILVEYKGWKIRPLICYDLRFPVWSRNKHRVENGKAIPEFDVLLYVANWPDVRSLPWDALLRARAIENQVYCIGLNRIGMDGNNKEYNGHSAVIDPKGNYLLEPAHMNNEIYEVELNFEDLQNFRDKFPQGLDADDFTLA